MHIIKVCCAGSCERNFGASVLKKAEDLLGITAGESTVDGKFRLEKVGCLSQCESAPNVMFCRAESPLSVLLNQGTIMNHCLPSRLEKEINTLKNAS